MTIEAVAAIVASIGFAVAVMVASQASSHRAYQRYLKEKQRIREFNDKAHKEGTRPCPYDLKWE